MSEARATPRQLAGLAGLVVLAGYFLLCASLALQDEYPPFFQEYPYALWMGNWQMFTLLDDHHLALEAHAQVDGQWEPVDLEALFVTRWESGPRYARSSFPQKPERMSILGAAVCGRLAERGVEADEVRFRQVRWPKRVGQAEQSIEGAQKRRLTAWRCGDEAPLPDGVRL